MGRSLSRNSRTGVLVASGKVLGIGFLAFFVCLIGLSLYRGSYTVRERSHRVVVNSAAEEAVPKNSSDTMGKGSGVPMNEVVDTEYPGTAVRRLQSVLERVSQLSEGDLSGEWEDVRQKILWAGGLRDLKRARPGEGYTGHSFNDFNHCDLTTMVDGEADSENDGRVEGIHFQNRLGNGIRVASIPDLGPGGSWSTCMMGCKENPPQDVAHIQFRSRIAFKLVWAPPSFDQFVLVDDDGKLLAVGKPTGDLPGFPERQMNYRVVQGSKYAVAADNLASAN